MIVLPQASDLVLAPLERPRPFTAPVCGPRNGTGEGALKPKPRERRPKPTRARRGGVCTGGSISVQGKVKKKNALAPFRAARDRRFCEEQHNPPPLNQPSTNHCARDIKEIKQAPMATRDTAPVFANRSQRSEQNLFRGIGSGFCPARGAVAMNASVELDCSKETPQPVASS